MLARYCPEKELPPYSFIPGENPHPLKAGGFWETQGEPHCQKIPEDDPLRNRDFAYAIDLYNFKFYWESHVYFEALWNAHQRSGDIAQLLKAIIIDAAGMVKTNKNQQGPAKTHFDRSMEILKELKYLDKLVGIDINKFINNVSIGKREIEIN